MCRTPVLSDDDAPGGRQQPGVSANLRCARIGSPIPAITIDNVVRMARRWARLRYVVMRTGAPWREYFEQHVLPGLGARAVVLNWSERKRWRVSLPVVLVGVFGGSRDFNPMAIVFEPLAWPRRFRFYRAFRAFKHGQRDDVEALRREFFAALDGVTRTPA